ncbi:MULTISPECIES: EAL domain-containing protein [Pseudomonas]|uniref:EAL domain, c-di-GMP-specific phosphodiesterase class I (Or its enzymatically inactive variant) n=1 Tax=Pseudomonas lutea TaxID=243924 RepID=A0A9X8M952_9PSED|nr:MULTISPECIES: EAL domain-containing protein [Pseudomonas]SEP68028.1 EAL domain, c-di-GMP-specific phosphodiesterase class I (or its enzymatically inactive variant) [Pseudomonas lutea]
MKTFFPEELTNPMRCQGCHQSEPLGFDFAFAYQPIVDVTTRSIFAHEALVRGPEGQGALSVLERVDAHNRYRFDQLCRTKAISGAAKLGMKEKLSINFLPNAVYRPELCIRSTLEAAKRHDFPLSNLIFETVESEHIGDSQHLTHILKEYRQFGFMTAIDDFGAGHSDLNLLAAFQPDLIKLDMALIRNIDHDRVRQAIVRAVVSMCTELNIQIIAEGIETAAERDCLRDIGITLMQGYWFAKPAFNALASIDKQIWGH